MTATKLMFTGFNGFGQFENLSKVISSFNEIHLEPMINNTKIIRCQWNYCAYVDGSNLYMCGYLNGEFNQRRRFPFEYAIKDVACAEHFCLVLLDIGIAYRINCQTFDVNEINSTIIQRSTLGGESNVSRNAQDIFGHFSAQHENQLNSYKDEFITHIAVGRSLSIVVTNKNNVYNMPLKIFTFPAHVKIKKVACGNEHCLILTSNGDLYAFGSSSRGQLGLGSLESEEVPILIEALAGIKIIDMATGGWHSVAVSAFNDLYVWGWNVNGQIGQPLYKTYEITLKNGQIRSEQQKCSTVFASPLVVDLPIDRSALDSVNEEILSENQYHAISVSAGARHTVVKVEEGLLLGAGWNKYGQLADDKLENDFDQFHIIQNNFPKDVNIICGEWSTFVTPSS